MEGTEESNTAKTSNDNDLEQPIIAEVLITPRKGSDGRVAHTNAVKEATALPERTSGTLSGTSSFRNVAVQGCHLTSPKSRAALFSKAPFVVLSLFIRAW